MFLYRHKACPVHLYPNIRTERARQGIRRFSEATHVLIPVYNTFLAGVETGVYRITELAPDACFSSETRRSLNAVELGSEELGYRTSGWSEGQEELLLLIRLARGEMLELGLTRSRADGFSSLSGARLKTLLPGVQRLPATHVARVRTENQNFSKVPVLDQLLGEFGSGAPTERERQLARRALKGHSGESVALSLGASLSTVKSHRQNLYAELGISTQQELFNPFLNSISQFLE